MFSDPREAIQLMIESTLSDKVNTSTPGTIVSFNAATNRAVVKPVMPKRLDNEESLDSPKIVEVPIAFHSSGGGKASFTMPLQPGDPVTLHFQQRSLEGWLDGKTDMPDDPRQFDLSDCIATPGGGASGTVAHADNVVLKFDKTFVSLNKDNSITMGNDKGSITIDSAGTMTLKAQSIKVETTPRNFVLETHTHKNVQPGGGNSGVPNP